MRRYVGSHMPITAERYVEVYGWEPEDARAMVREGNSEPLVTVHPDEGPTHLLPNVRDDGKTTGFEWGYEGAGPAALAASILADLFGGEPDAALVLDFKVCFIASQTKGLGFEFSDGEIREWIDERAEIGAPA